MKICKNDRLPSGETLLSDVELDGRVGPNIVDRGIIIAMSRIWEALQKVEKLRDVEGVAPQLMPDNIRLTAKQSLAIQALLRTSTIEEAATAAGVTEMSLRRWLGRPGFVAAYYSAGRAEIEGSLARLDSATETAMAVLEQARDLLQRVQDRAGDAVTSGKQNGHGKGRL